MIRNLSLILVATLALVVPIFDVGKRLPKFVVSQVAS